MNLLRSIITAALFAAALPSAIAQVAVYRVSFEQSEDSLNLDFYDDGFLVCPALGGTCSLILVEDQGGLKVFDRSDGIGRHFVALGPSAFERKAVFSTFVQNGTAEAYYMMSGTLDAEITGSTALFEFRSFIASNMSGYVLASDDEAGATALALDGSLGYAGLAKMEAYYLGYRTQTSNDRGLSVQETANEIVNLLRGNGYIRDGETPTGTAVQAINGATGTDIEGVVQQLDAAPVTTSADPVGGQTTAAGVIPNP